MTLLSSKPYWQYPFSYFLSESFGILELIYRFVYRIYRVPQHLMNPHWLYHTVTAMININPSDWNYNPTLNMINQYKSATNPTKSLICLPSITTFAWSELPPAPAQTTQRRLPAKWWLAARSGTAGAVPIFLDIMGFQQGSNGIYWDLIIGYYNLI
jgi:hypothetical protein